MSFELSFEGGPELHVRSFRVVERMSEPFSIEVVVRSPDPSVELGSLVGHAARFTIAPHVRQGVAIAGRSWSGLCLDAAQLAVEPAGLSTYRIRVVPSLWLLDGRTSHRIFTARTAPEIVEEILDEWGLGRVFRVERGDYPTYVSRTQYRESDGSFLRRLLEEAGIAFTFEDGTSAVLFDDALETRAVRAGGALRVLDRATPAAALEHATDLVVAERSVSGARTVTGCDLGRPDRAIRASASLGDRVPPRSEEHVYRPGAFAAWQGGDVGDHEEVGAFLATRALEAERAHAREISFATNVCDLPPGTLFALRGEAAQELEDKKLLATELSIEASVTGDWNVRVRAVMADRPYRPRAHTPRPHIGGIHVAIVAGAESEDDVHTESHGRARLRFPWDARFRGVDAATPWARVAAPWAGAAFGQTLLPRVGQEVLVAFEDGDPDRPVVVGRVANVTAPVPYALPARKTESGWRSESLPRRSGFNEIRFEDALGDELVELRAQRDWRALVRNDEAITIGQNRTQRIGGEGSETTLGRRFQLTGGRREERTAVDSTAVAGAGRSKLVDGEREETFEKDHYLRVDGDAEQRIGGDDIARCAGHAHTYVEGRHLERVSGIASLQVPESSVRAAAASIAAGGDVGMRGANLVVESTDISLSAGGSFLRIDGGGVTIHGPLVTINEGGAPAAYVPARLTQPLAPKLPAPLKGRPTTRVVMVDAAGTELSGTVEVVVGEEVILEIREDPALHALGVQWQLEPAVDAVEDYVFNQQEGTVTKLGSLSTTRVSFFWIAVGTKRVRALVTLDGVPVEAPIEVEMNVLGARNVVATWEVGSEFAIREFKSDRDSTVTRPGGAHLALGDPTPPPDFGISFIYEAYAPLGREGYVAGVQRGQVRLSAIDEAGDRWGAEWTGHWHNDSGYGKGSMYDGLYAPFNETKFGGEWKGSVILKGPKGTGITKEFRYGDAPNQWIDRTSPKLVSVEVDYNFETFYLFKVEEDNRRVIWTTVAKLAWKARARAARDASGTWKIDKTSVVQPAAPADAKGNPTLILTAELPEWSGVIQDPKLERI